MEGCRRQADSPLIGSGRRSSVLKDALLCKSVAPQGSEGRRFADSSTATVTLVSGKPLFMLASGHIPMHSVMGTDVWRARFLLDLLSRRDMSRPGQVEPLRVWLYSALTRTSLGVGKATSHCSTSGGGGDGV